MGPATRALVAERDRPRSCALETLRASRCSRSGPDGGLAEMAPSGFLNVHRDFLAHTTRTHWSRQVNLLLFLNSDWPDDYGGDLELWDAGVTRCVRSILPVMNRCVIFVTSKHSFHGVPRGVHCLRLRSPARALLFPRG
jgi:Rps23 Pro-64 3,4-dihydroxylase Tpa1-like proline 4-hydroxylase